MTRTDDHNPELPCGLRDLERSLDALGERSRSDAPEGLAERICAATSGTITALRPGELRLSGTEAETHGVFRIGRHWRLAASVALLVIAVVAVITLQRPAINNGGDTGAPVALSDEWVDFEVSFVSDSGFDSDALNSLDSELDALELSFNEAWTLDESLTFNDGESL